MYKVGRNDNCPCGSGLKYKKCCLRRQDNPNINIETPEDFKKLRSRVKKSANIKGCLHPNKSECNKTIKAHSIQNNKVLSQIAENGEVWQPISDDMTLSDSSFMRGRNVASTFFGMCEKHDKIFAPIEDNNFEGTSCECFLHTYRAFIYQLYIKTKVRKEFQTMFKDKPSAINQYSFVGQILGYKNAMKDFEKIKKSMDYILLSQSYDDMAYHYRTVEAKSYVASSGFESLPCDFDGNIIQDLSDDRLTGHQIYYSLKWHS